MTQWGVSKFSWENFLLSLGLRYIVLCMSFFDKQTDVDIALSLVFHECTKNFEVDSHFD